MIVDYPTPLAWFPPDYPTPLAWSADDVDDEAVTLLYEDMADDGAVIRHMSNIGPWLCIAIVAAAVLILGITLDHMQTEQRDQDARPQVVVSATHH